MPRKQPDVIVARVVWFVNGVQQPGEGALGPNRSAAEQVVKRLRERRIVVAGHEALTTLFLMLAEAVDAAPTDARLWGQYRDAELALRALAREKAPDEDDWTETVGATQVRHAARPKPRQPRASGGRGVAKAGNGPDAAPAARVGRRPRAGS